MWAWGACHRLGQRGLHSGDAAPFLCACWVRNTRRTHWVRGCNPTKEADARTNPSLPMRSIEELKLERIKEDERKKEIKRKKDNMAMNSDIE